MLHDLRSTARWLRKNFTVEDRKVIVKLVDRTSLGANTATTEWAHKTFVIRIDRSLPLLVQIEWLIHEWAHAMTLPRRRERKEFHTHEWSRTLGLIHAAREKYLGNP